MKHFKDNKTIFSSAADHILLYYCENFTVPTERMTTYFIMYTITCSNLTLKSFLRELNSG